MTSQGIAKFIVAVVIVNCSLLLKIVKEKEKASEGKYQKISLPGQVIEICCNGDIGTNQLQRWTHGHLRISLSATSGHPTVNINQLQDLTHSALETPSTLSFIV